MTDTLSPDYTLRNCVRLAPIFFLNSFFTLHTGLATAVSSVRVGGLAHWTAFTIRNDDLLTVGHLITVHIVTQDGAAVTDADPARLWFPHVSVGVHLPILKAAEVISCRKKIDHLRSADFLFLLQRVFMSESVFTLNRQAHTCYAALEPKTM